MVWCSGCTQFSCGVLGSRGANATTVALLALTFYLLHPEAKQNTFCFINKKQIMNSSFRGSRDDSSRKDRITFTSGGKKVGGSFSSVGGSARGPKSFQRGAGRPSFGSRPSFGGDRAPRGDRPSFADRAPRGDRPSFGGARPRFDRGGRGGFDRGSRGGDRGGRPSFGGGRGGRGNRARTYFAVSQYINRNPVQVKEEKAVVTHAFADFGLDKKLVSIVVDELKYTEPS